MTQAWSEIESSSKERVILDILTSDSHLTDVPASEWQQAFDTLVLLTECKRLSQGGPSTLAYLDFTEEDCLPEGTSKQGLEDYILCDVVPLVEAELKAQRTDMGKRLPESQ